MKLLRLRLRPLSAWRTPWQADTLSGLICWAAARLGQRELLEDGISRPALRGDPPFVLSDAFPGELLPIPAAVRLQDWPEAQRKAVKRARWLSRESFLMARRGEHLKIEQLLDDSRFITRDRLRNTLDRTTHGTPECSGLWPSHETWLEPSQSWLSLYARVSEPFQPHLIRLLHELSTSGFGADSSAGLGQFETTGEPESADWLDDVPDGTGGCVAFSTYQPAAHDPTDGFWESFVKYGKLGPDFGVENVFKRPLLMLRPGACFTTTTLRPFLGRAVPMGELLPADAAAALQAQGRQAVQYAYALAVPFPPP